MATAKEFVARIDGIAGVEGCLLVRDDGALLGQTVDDPEAYSTLMVLSGGLATEVMERSGFSYCRHLCFNRQSKENFYIFPIDKYLLGVVQQTECAIPEMLDAVYRLVSRVTTGSSSTEGIGD